MRLYPREGTGGSGPLRKGSVEGLHWDPSFPTASSEPVHGPSLSLYQFTPPLWFRGQGPGQESQMQGQARARLVPSRQELGWWTGSRKPGMEGIAHRGDKQVSTQANPRLTQLLISKTEEQTPVNFPNV